MAAETLCTLGAVAASAYKPGEDQRPSSDALELAGRVNAAARTLCGDRCPTMALFRNATAPNTILLVDAGKAKMVYAPQFFTSVYETWGDNGVAAIIAHEVGHALDDAMGAAWINKNWSAEMRADAWAGCVLARMDLGADGIEPGLNALSKFPAPSNTNWNTRSPAIRTGYAQCGGNAAKFGEATRK
jgi:hypothetical protein